MTVSQFKPPYISSLRREGKEKPKAGLFFVKKRLSRASPEAQCWCCPRCALDWLCAVIHLRLLLPRKAELLFFKFLRKLLSTIFRAKVIDPGIIRGNIIVCVVGNLYDIVVVYKRTVLFLQRLIATCIQHEAFVADNGGYFSHAYVRIFAGKVVDIFKA